MRTARARSRWRRPTPGGRDGDGATRMTLRNRGEPTGFATLAAPVDGTRHAPRQPQGPGQPQEHPRSPLRLTDAPDQVGVVATPIRSPTTPLSDRHPASSSPRITKPRSSSSSSSDARRSRAARGRRWPATRAPAVGAARSPRSRSAHRAGAPGAPRPSPRATRFEVDRSHVDHRVVGPRGRFRVDHVRRWRPGRDPTDPSAPRAATPAGPSPDRCRWRRRRRLRAPRRSARCRRRAAPDLEHAGARLQPSTEVPHGGHDEPTLGGGARRAVRGGRTEPVHAHPASVVPPRSAARSVT